MKVETNSSDFLPASRQNRLLFSRGAIDYALGFILGMVCSIFSFYILGMFKERKKKRVGMFWGCLASFAIILAFCVSFTFYTSYVQRTKQQYQRGRADRDRKLAKILTFREYIKSALGKLTAASPKVEQKLKSSRSLKRTPKLIHHKKAKLKVKHSRASQKKTRVAAKTRKNKRKVKANNKKNAKKSKHHKRHNIVV
jgi:hypothetical protein